MRRRALIVAVLGVVLLAGCESSGSSSSPPEHRAPARSARLFCDRRARREISTSLGVAPVRVTRPRTAGSTFSCRYMYPNGEIAVSVRRLPDEAAAARYFAAVGEQRGRRPEAFGFGEGLRNFFTTDGSMIVRNHRDVLDVDVSALPSRFGEPPQEPSFISLAVTITILGRWEPG